MRYQSPVDLIVSEMNMKLEGTIFKAVQNVGVNVDRDAEIVRCKDCVNSGTSRCPCHYSGDPYIDWTPDDDWFCADGERRTDDA